MIISTIGRGEGWRFVGVVRADLPAFNGNLGTPLAAGRAFGGRSAGERIAKYDAALAPDVVSPAALDAEGFDVHVNPYGRVFIRNPDLPSVFAPKRPQAAEAQS